MLMFYFTNPEIVKQEDEHEILNAMEQLLAKEHQEWSLPHYATTFIQLNKEYMYLL